MGEEFINPFGRLPKLKKLKKDEATGVSEGTAAVMFGDMAPKSSWADFKQQDEESMNQANDLLLTANSDWADYKRNTSVFEITAWF